MQSYGLNYGKEAPESELWTDASGPLHFYHRTSSMRDDTWHYWHITDKDDEPETGSQNYNINTWYKAPGAQWHYQEMRDYSMHPNPKFRGWHIPKGFAMDVYIPEPSAPPPIAVVESSPTPIVMGEVVGYTVLPEEDEQDGSGRPMLGRCCPFV